VGTKKIIFSILSVFLLYSFFFLHADIKQNIQSETTKLFEITKPMALDLTKTNDALDILDDDEIEKLSKNIAESLKKMIPIMKKLPQDKKEPPTPEAKPPSKKAQIKKERATLLKAIGLLYLCAGTLELNKAKAQKVIDTLSKDELNNLKKTLTGVIKSLEAVKLEA